MLAEGLHQSPPLLGYLRSRWVQNEKEVQAQRVGARAQTRLARTRDQDLRL